MAPRVGGREREHLLDAVAHGPLDAHAATLRAVLDCDAALVTVHDSDDQRFIGMDGIQGPAQRRRSTPLDRAVCQEVVSTGAAVRLDDLAADRDHRRHPALTHLGIEAYLGVPLHAPSGKVVGTVCALHHAPHAWSDTDLEHLERLRGLAERELRRLLESTADRARHDETSLVLATLRHELGGELGVVLGGIETAMRPGIDQEVRRRVLTHAQRDCHRAIAILDALLRIDRHDPEQLQEVDVPTLVQETIGTTAARHDTSRLEVVAEPLVLVTEPTLLAHVLRNLLDNACRYSTGQVRITASAADRGLQLVVADAGSGIPDDVLDHLSRPRSRPHRDGGGSGFGLGLSAVRMLCQRLDAGIAVDTGEHGTTVTVLVPDRGQSPKPSNAASSSDGA